MLEIEYILLFYDRIGLVAIWFLGSVNIVLFDDEKKIV